MESKDILKNVVELSLANVEISVSSASILSGTREVQNAATTMASAVEELAASISEIERSAQTASASANESSHLTNQGVQEMGGLKNKIMQTGTIFETVANKTRDLQAVVSNLGEVVKLISKIANQTNLLALNASIEAARAGEHGRGFAVVANEVKSLSRQTATATETIQSQIGELNNSFGEVLTAVAEVQETVTDVVNSSQKVTDDFGRIDQNSSQISERINELAHIISDQRQAVELLAQNMGVVKQKGDVNLGAVERLVDQTDRSVTLIENWRTELAKEDIENKVIYLAQADHLLWKKRLLDLAVGRSNLKSKDLTDHTACRLGKWYYAVKSEFAGVAAFTAIEAPHQKVHYHGIEAAKCFEQNLLDEGLVHYAHLDEASAKVISGLQQLLVYQERMVAQKQVA